MRKVIREILGLLWKVLRLLLWKWLRPILAKGAVFVALAAGFVMLLIWLIARF